MSAIVATTQIPEKISIYTNIHALNINRTSLLVCTCNKVESRIFFRPARWLLHPSLIVILANRWHWNNIQALCRLGSFPECATTGWNLHFLQRLYHLPPIYRVERVFIVQGDYTSNTCWSQVSTTTPRWLVCIRKRSWRYSIQCRARYAKSKLSVRKSVSVYILQNLSQWVQ